MAMVTPANAVYTYHFNAIGSTVAMSDSTQAIVNKYSYDPFGNVMNQVEAIPQPFKFVGQYGVMTEPNGFYYMRARYYDPEVGRFISEDPIGFDGGDVNLMAYVGNNPILLIDPWGLREQSSPLVDMAKGTAFGFMAAGVVTIEVSKIVVLDVAKVLITSQVPSTLAGEFAIDKSFTAIEITKNVAGDYREIAERVGRRIENLREWWYEK